MVRIYRNKRSGIQYLVRTMGWSTFCNGKHLEVESDSKRRQPGEVLVANLNAVREHISRDMLGGVGYILMNPATARLLLRAGSAFSDMYRIGYKVGGRRVGTLIVKPNLIKARTLEEAHNRSGPQQPEYIRRLYDKQSRLPNIEAIRRRVVLSEGGKGVRAAASGLVSYGHMARAVGNAAMPVVTAMTKPQPRPEITNIGGTTLYRKASTLSTRTMLGGESALTTAGLLFPRNTTNDEVTGHILEIVLRGMLKNKMSYGWASDRFIKERTDKILTTGGLIRNLLTRNVNGVFHLDTDEGTIYFKVCPVISGNLAHGGHATSVALLATKPIEEEVTSPEPPVSLQSWGQR